MSAVVKRFDDLNITTMGDIFAKSGYFRDIRDQSQAIVKILYGAELGFSPVVSLLGIHVIEGKPSLSSNLLGTLVKRSGKYDYRVRESTDKGCVLEFFTRNGDKWESLGLSGFSMEDAQRAGLVKPNGGWAKYPRAMTFARALSAGVRLHCPDVSACPLYVPEELGATVDEEGAVTELPPSARPVAVTEEPVTFTKPNGRPVASDLGVAGKGSTTEAEPTNPIPAISPAAPLPTSQAEAGRITTKQATTLHTRFRQSLREDLRGRADLLLYDFLIFSGYKRDDGTTSALLIPADLFAEIGRAAVAHAKEL